MANRQDSVEGLELTEKIVLTRTRAPDLESVRKLNCWASNINDVSVVRRMPNLEVCSLSINRITSLRDFAHCHKLKELYVRTNRISCLGDIHYLKSLRRLRSLWLSENPCADTEGYRLIVLKTLPHLQKLDNTAVTPEEVLEASSLEEIPIPQDFSASSVFHPGFTDSSVSSVSSIDSHFNKQSTDTSVSYEHLPIARKKREERRLKKAKEEESGRKSLEEESLRTEEDSEINSSGEFRQKKNDNSDSTSDNVGSEDEYNKNPQIEGKDEEKRNDDDDYVEKLPESAVVQETVNNDFIQDNASSEKMNSQNGEGSRPTCLSNHISDESSVSGSQDSSVSNKSHDDAAVGDDDDDGGGDDSTKDRKQEKVNDDNKGSGRNDVGVSDSSVNKGVNKSNDGNISEEIYEDKIGSGGSGSMLDKIRLNDSLALDEEPAAVHDSIELDDLVIEVEGEKTSASNADNDKNNNCNSSTEEECVPLEQVEKCLMTSDKDSSASAVSTVMNGSVSSPSASGTSPRTRSVGVTGTPVENAKEERLSKMESVDWDEYNRMRQDLGMRPIERVSSSKPVHADITRVRNSNILQAVLSLVKELDKDSLDLVVTAVKARRDNL